MFKHNLIQSWRQLAQKPLLSFLKVMGLGLGIAVSLLLIKYINWQWNFDRFHEHAVQIVRVESHHTDSKSAVRHHAISYAGLPVMAKEAFPEVLDYVRFGRWIANDVVIRHDEELYRGPDLFFTDPSFLTVFSFELLEGDPVNALKDPNSVVLTQSIAKLLFGDEPAIGKEVLFENLKPLQVTGIVADPPTQSHIQFDILASLSTMTNWGLDVYGDQQLEAAYVYSYLLLDQNVDQDALAKDITKVLASKRDADKQKDYITLQPMQEIYLQASLEGDMQDIGGGNNLWILGGIALFILLLGWINYFNIFYATSLGHAGSLSVQRIIGAERRDLFAHLTINAGLGVLIALFLGFIIVWLLQPWIAERFGIPLNEVQILDFQGFDPASYLLAFLVLGAMLSILIPAILLSKTKSIIQINQSATKKILGLRQQPVLIAIQFAIIIGLISATLIVRQQTTYMQKQDLGLNTENVLAIRAPLGVDFELLKTNMQPFINEIKALPGVEQFSVSHNIPGDEIELVMAEQTDPQGIPFNHYRNYSDEDYFSLFDVSFLAIDSAKIASESNNRYCFINKMAADILGFVDPQKALGKQFNRWGSTLEVVGVVENFHQRSLHHSMVPIVHDFSRDNILSDGFYSIRHTRDDYQTFSGEIKNLYHKFFPYTVYDPIIVEDHFRSQYQAEDQFYLLNLVFSALGLVIGCLGLLALIILTIGKRMKEISIRRILGATLANVVLLLSKDYLKIILLAFLLATPTAYYLMNKWLVHFAYRVEISIGTFLLATIFASFIGFIIIFLQGLRATNVSPVETLRSE